MTWHTRMVLASIIAAANILFVAAMIMQAIDAL